MLYIIALLAALIGASIPLAIMQRSSGEQPMAEALGLVQERRRFSLDDWARQSNTGLTGSQILIGGLAWSVGGLLLGLSLSPLLALLFAVAGGLLYYGSLQEKRQERRTKQAVQVARAMGIMETILGQGRSLQEAVEQAAQSSPPEGRETLMDLVYRMREVPANDITRAVREWSQAWDNPSVDMLAAALIAALDARIEIAPLVGALRRNIQAVSSTLKRNHAEAQGIIWQTRFLTFWPIVVLTAVALMNRQWGMAYHNHPVYALPALIGGALTWILGMRQIRNGLSIEAAVGIGEHGEGEIQLDRLGKVL